MSMTRYYFPRFNCKESFADTKDEYQALLNGTDKAVLTAIKALENFPLLGIENAREELSLEEIAPVCEKMVEIIRSLVCDAFGVWVNILEKTYNLEYQPPEWAQSVHRWDEWLKRLD